MKKLFWIFLVFSAASVSCKNQPLKSDECRAFWHSVEQDWVYDVKTRTYSVQAKEGRKNMDFVQQLVYDREECWKGMTAKRVRKVFGEPSKVKGGRWDYFLDAECWQEKGKNCNYFTFVVSDEDGLMDVELNAYSISN
jgi:hypothetical protein